ACPGRSEAERLLGHVAGAAAAPVAAEALKKRPVGAHPAVEVDDAEYPAGVVGELQSETAGVLIAGEGRRTCHGADGEQRRAENPSHFVNPPERDRVSGP